MDSWRANAGPWCEAVREGRIESRELITNSAIIDAVLERSPNCALDAGCGEGWLVRALEQQGVTALGIDAIPELVELASAEGVGKFRVLSYEDLSADDFEQRFDAVVCNFSLIGKESVSRLFAEVSALLTEGGALIVQTLHPIVVCGDREYVDGWRDGSWEGIGGDFSAPAPWYFRTVESWESLYLSNGYSACEIVEPFSTQNKRPASLIMIGEK
ncbi:class I SAM-dependent methyltransferase [Candidatus Reidiella endopervernicosa]|uniref:class I SAM-dependent methyltransferase n=1 Tax=Candidatus Reidiella endopervernicosa TaxID=2738883 RepID=UPI0026C512F2|nr:class I SAM-dependent methyltransferase [Candidatus Reidiella endopervernicosa]